MNFQIVAVVLGGLAIIAFIIKGFWSGRQNRVPLVRDEKSERNAKVLEPTVENTAVDTKEPVTIIESQSIVVGENEDSEAKDGEVGSMYINAEDEKPEVDKSAKVQNNESLASSLLNKFKSFFKPKNVQPPEEKEEPKSVYQINIVKSDMSKISVLEASMLCQKYNLVLGDHNIYYHLDDDNREVFKICGSSAPYSLDGEGTEGVEYDALFLFMTLPDRGMAEDSYLAMVQFGFLLTKELDGRIVDNNRQNVNEEVILKNRDVLSEYDKLSEI